jgi:hypothetical protein
MSQKSSVVQILNSVPQVLTSDNWHHWSAGYKVRHVPATLPDILKTDRMLYWEYASFRERRSREAYSAMQDQPEWLSSGVSDYEIALPIYEIEVCAAGTAC